MYNLTLEVLVLRCMFVINDAYSARLGEIKKGDTMLTAGLSAVKYMATLVVEDPCMKRGMSSV